MKIQLFDHGLPNNPHNKHAWILGKPEIGERVWIGSFCVIDALHAPLKIGRGTDISSGVQIITHTTLKRCVSERRYGKIDAAPTEIGEFSFIGTNATILKGCKIGHHSVIGAGAIVSENTVIPPYSLAIGIPAKIVGSTRKYLKNIEKESISVVIPAYNEQTTVEGVAKEALNALVTIVKDYEVVLVNDGSTDDTGKIIDSLAKKHKHIRAIHHKQNKGFTGAMRTSFKSASKHLVFLAPADGQFNFSELGKFFEAIRGYDVALAYRIDNKDYKNRIIRQVNTWGYHWLSRLLFDIRFTEFSSVSMWRRRVLQSIEIKSDDRGAMMLIELVHKAIKQNYRFVEVPITWHKRKGGKEKGANPKVIWRTLVGMMKLWWQLRYAE